VLDAASNTANLAQGTIFIVKGTNLCPGTTLTAFGIPRPTVSPDGVQITFTPAAGGTGTNALLWYEDPLGGGAATVPPVVIVPLPEKVKLMPEIPIDSDPARVGNEPESPE